MMEYWVDPSLHYSIYSEGITHRGTRKADHPNILP